MLPEQLRTPGEALDAVHELGAVGGPDRGREHILEGSKLVGCKFLKESRNHMTKGLPLFNLTLNTPGVLDTSKRRMAPKRRGTPCVQTICGCSQCVQSPEPPQQARYAQQDSCSTASYVRVQAGHAQGAIWRHVLQKQQDQGGYKESRSQTRYKRRTGGGGGTKKLRMETYR